MANVIQQLQKSPLVLAHNKTLAAQLYGEFISCRFHEQAAERLANVPDFPYRLFLLGDLIKVTNPVDYMDVWTE